MNGSGSGMDRKPVMNPVEKFEKAFQACLSVVTKEDTLSNLDHDELRVDTEHAIQDLMEQAHVMEGYFLKKRLHIAHLKPELVLKDDTNELRLELMRKDELLKKNFEKMGQWQSILADVQSVTTASVGGKTGGVTIGNPVGNPGGGGAQHQGPLTPGTPGGGGSGRPLTPASVGRPQTPVGQGGGMPGGPQGGARAGVGFSGPMGPQGHPSGLQGPLAFLEKTASTIGHSGANDGGGAQEAAGASKAGGKGKPSKKAPGVAPGIAPGGPPSVNYEFPIQSPLSADLSSPAGGGGPGVKPKRKYTRKPKPSQEGSEPNTPTPPAQATEVKTEWT